MPISSEQSLVSGFSRPFLPPVIFPPAYIHLGERWGKGAWRGIGKLYGKKGGVKEGWRVRKKTHASSPSTSGKTHEKTCPIQTRLENRFVLPLERTSSVVLDSSLCVESRMKVTDDRRPVPTKEKIIDSSRIEKG